ncbi:MAG TPA: MopE-related protein [Polyangiaceae bacterium]|nr:MopE-related protein [Polyangiaceae bacterium]
MAAFGRALALVAVCLGQISVGCSASGTADSPGDGSPAGGTNGASAGGATSGSTGGSTTGGDSSFGGSLFGAGGATSSGGAPVTGAGGGSGAGACSGTPAVPPDVQSAEVCGNGLDDDLNGFVDENCRCSSGATQECFLGTASQAAAENCHKGTQTCSGTPEFPAWGPCEGSGCGVVVPAEVCENGVDDNCDGRVDEGCTFDMTVAIDGDCLAIPCPPQAPNPVGCQIDMQGGDSRGCVAHAAGNDAVYFQEGDACPIPGCQLFNACGDSGHISGTLRCSASPTPVTLDETNCAINKTEKIYTDAPSGCP